MDIGMNDVDDILRGFGMNVPSSDTASAPTEETGTNEEPTSSLTDDDVSDILQENGFSQESQEEDFEGEGNEEEVENTEYLENQGEGGDLAVEQINLQQAEDEFPEAMEEHLENEATTEADGEEDIETPMQEETPSEEALIPLNSPTLLIDDSTSRFSGAEWYNEIQRQRIIVGGCGGIGSNLIFQLARMIPANITIYDDDDVELVNMAGQLYSYNDIGKAKVNAIADMVSSYTSMRQVNAIKERFTSSTEAGNIMICGFDNMRARKTFFNSWVEHLNGKTEEEKTKCLYMDGRLDISTLQILCIRGDDDYNIARYQSEFLFSDYEAEQTICSMKQTTYLACMIGSLMVNLFTNFVAGTLNPILPYDLPFFTEYDAQNMIFKTES